MPSTSDMQPLIDVLVGILVANYFKEASSMPSSRIDDSTSNRNIAELQTETASLVG